MSANSEKDTLPVQQTTESHDCDGNDDFGPEFFSLVVFMAGLALVIWCGVGTISKSVWLGFLAGVTFIFTVGFGMTLARFLVRIVENAVRRSLKLLASSLDKRKQPPGEPNNPEREVG